MSLTQSILDKRIIAILRGLTADEAIKVAEALSAGGISLIEVTFPQQEGADLTQTVKAIEGIRARFGQAVLAGAGTVMNTQQLALAVQAGAQYIISPNVDEAVIRETRSRGLISMPGALTPTEAVAAHNYGANFVKIFPAGNLGPDYIKALRGPLSHIRFLAVGGVGVANAGDFIRAGAVGLGVGGKLADRALIQAGRLDEITALAQQYTAAVAQAAQQAK